MSRDEENQSVNDSEGDGTENSYGDGTDSSEEGDAYSGQEDSGGESGADSLDEFVSPPPKKKKKTKEPIKAQIVVSKKSKSVVPKTTPLPIKKSLARKGKLCELGVKTKKQRCTMKTKYPVLNIRNLPSTFIGAVREFTDVQKEWVRSMGFEHMLKLEITEIPRYLAYWIVDNFDEVRCELVMENGKTMHFTEDDVHRILGLPRGQNTIRRRKKTDDPTILKEWKKECGGNYEVRPMELANKLEKCEDEKWFKRHFLAFFISLLVQSNQKGTVMQKLFIEDVSDVANMNWCEFVIKSLVDSKIEWKKNKKRFFQGPILFLMLFYVDGVTILGKTNRSSFPVFLAWTDKLLKQRQKDEDKLGGFGLGHIVDRAHHSAMQIASGEGPSTHQTRPENSSNIEGCVKLIEGKARKCETAIVELVDMIEQIPNDMKNDGKLRKMLQAAKGLIGKSPEQLEKGDNSDGEIWQRLEKVEACRERLKIILESSEEWMTVDDIARHYKGGSVDEQPVTDTNVDMEYTRDETENSEEVHRTEQAPVLPTTETPQVEGEGATTGVNLDTTEVPTDKSIEEDPKQKKGKAKVKVKVIGPSVPSMQPDQEQKEKGKRKVGVERQDIDNTRPKRATRRGESLRSPYVKRTVTILRVETEEEKLLWAFVFTDFGVGDCIQNMFKHAQWEASRSKLMSLDTVLDPSVIDIWSLLLNKGETEKSGDKPCRLFAKVFKPAEDNDKLAFTAMLNDAVSLVDGRESKHIEMILVPVLLGDSHYILVSFNLKYHAMEILDSLVSDSTMEERYGDTPEIIRNLVIHYLDLRRLHIKKKAIQADKIQPCLVDIPWGDAKNKVASGIYTMRHMETYMGASIQGWEGEMTAENFKKSIVSLRVKYLHKIIMSDMNELKPMMVEKLATYKKKVGRPMKLLVTGM